MSVKEFLHLQHISKVFPGVKALNDIDMVLNCGEVHAVMGENGAGKSTLMNIITGVYNHDEGELIVEGKEVCYHGVDESRKAGISLVHQENSLLGYLDVKSNLYLGHIPCKYGFIKQKEMRDKTRQLFKELGIDNISPDAIVKNLSMANRQMVEIAKAISSNPKLLLLDEPTASLTEKETEILFNIIEMLKNKGVAIVYISHRMDEIFKVADVITVLRDGCHVKTAPASEFTIDTLIANMVGRSLNNQLDSMMQDRDKYIKDEVVLKVDNLCRDKEFEGISFELKKGEVLGLGGLVGAGRTELLEAIFGYTKIKQGKIFIKGKEVSIVHPSVAIKNKIGFIPEDRKQKGLSLIASIRENVNISTMKNHIKMFLLSEKSQNDTVNEMVKELNIKTPSIKKVVGELSGGNQQKVIISRWLLTKPDILLLDEPTHGIDVGAKAEIYRMIEDLTHQGISVILASSEMSELMMMSDRILVMYTGKMMKILDKEDFSQELILSYASGQEK